MDTNEAIAAALEALKEQAEEQARQHLALQGSFLLLARRLATKDLLDLTGLIRDLDVMIQLPENEDLQEEFAGVANGLRTVRHALEVAG